MGRREARAPSQLPPHWLDVKATGRRQSRRFQIAVKATTPTTRGATFPVTAILASLYTRILLGR